MKDLGRFVRLYVLENLVSQNLSALVQRGAELLLVYAVNDAGLDSLHVVFGNQLEQLRATGRVGLEVIAESDHTFTLLQNQQHLLQAIETWVRTREQWALHGEAVPLH